MISLLSKETRPPEETWEEGSDRWTRRLEDAVRDLAQFPCVTRRGGVVNLAAHILPLFLW